MLARLQETRWLLCMIYHLQTYQLHPNNTENRLDEYMNEMATMQDIITAARPAYAGTKGCFVLLAFFYLFFI